MVTLRSHLKRVTHRGRNHIVVRAEDFRPRANPESPRDYVVKEVFKRLDSLGSLRFERSMTDRTTDSISGQSTVLEVWITPVCDLKEARLEVSAASVVGV